MPVLFPCLYPISSRYKSNVCHLPKVQCLSSDDVLLLWVNSLGRLAFCPLRSLFPKKAWGVCLFFCIICFGASWCRSTCVSIIKTTGWYMRLVWESVGWGSGYEVCRSSRQAIGGYQLRPLHPWFPSCPRAADVLLLFTESTLKARWLLQVSGKDPPQTLRT